MSKKVTYGPDTPAPPEEILGPLFDYIADGVHIEVACAACCISKATYYQWTKLARSGQNAAYSAILDRIEQSVAKAEIESAALVLSHATQDRPGKERSAHFLLSRRFPKRWSDKSKVDVAIESKQPAEVIKGLREGFFGAGEEDESAGTIEAPEVSDE